MTQQAEPGARSGVGNIWIVPACVFATVLVFDQLTKIWAVRRLGPAEGQHVIYLIGDWFRLTFLKNTGVAFGLFQDMPQVFTVTSLVITAGALYFYRYHLPTESRWVQVTIGLIAGGAIGNVIDRIRLGYVIDFVSIGWWPIFNVADSAISVGVSMLAGYLLLTDVDKPRVTARNDVNYDEPLLRDLLSQKPTDEH
jgi:signal peptidase II